MKRIDLVRHLRLHDCELLRQGGRHEVWVNSQSAATASVPRHREVKTPTVRSICDGLGIPRPTMK